MFDIFPQTPHIEAIVELELIWFILFLQEFI
jgi:hypothetical protein